MLTRFRVFVITRPFFLYEDLMSSVLEIRCRAFHSEADVLPLSHILNPVLQTDLKLASIYVWGSCDFRADGLVLRALRVCFCQEFDLFHLTCRAPFLSFNVCKVVVVDSMVVLPPESYLLPSSLSPSLNIIFQCLQPFFSLDFLYCTLLTVLWRLFYSLFPLHAVGLVCSLLIRVNT